MEFWYKHHFIMGSGIPELENRVTHYEVKANDVIANFSLIFRNSEYLMKIKFPVTSLESFFFI